MSIIKNNKNYGTRVEITDPELEDLSVTSNGTYQSSTKYGYDEVTVNVQPNLTTLNATTNDTYTPTAPVQGYSSVTVNVPAPQLTTLNATSNNTFTPSSPYVGYSEVTVNVTPSLQNKSVTQNGTYTADQGYDGLGTVTVNVSSSQENYITLYFKLIQDKIYSNGYMTNSESWWIFNPDGGGATLIANIDKMYIDGVLQNQIVWSHKFTSGGVHTVKLVFKENANVIPDDSLRGFHFMDLTHFTGTVGCYDFNVNEMFFLLPENSTIGGVNGGGSYYLPASTDFRQNDRYVRGYPFWVDVNHQNYTSNTNGTLVMDSNNNIIGIGGNVFIPDTVTTFNPQNISISYYANKIVFSKELTDYYGVHSGAGTLAFLGAVPPTITPDQSEAEGKVFVPSGSESAYRTAFTNAGWNNMAANVNPINVATATFTYASGDDGIIIASGMDDASSHNILLVEIYDSNSQLVWRECPTNELNIMGEMLNGYGNYTVKMYFVDRIYDWSAYPHCLFNNSTATSVDFSEMATANFDYRIIANMPNVTEVTLSDSITSIGRENFYNCPNLSKVYIMAQQPPTVSSSYDDLVFANSNGGNPIEVVVPDPTAYEADSEWAALKTNGLITFSSLNI